jgi:hypothetical protein
MVHKPSYDLPRIAASFELGGDLIEVIPYGSGHINDTFLSRVRTDTGKTKYVHQRINHNVFKEPEKVMENMQRVTEHLRSKIIAAGGDPLRETLNLVAALDGRTFHIDDGGNYWRTLLFIEGARTYDVVEDLQHVYNASKAFGEFQRMVSDLPGGRLHETIPDFHNTRWRFEQFADALKNDVENRANSVKEEIDFVLARESDASVLVDLLAQGKTPERITHNDTKLNNVMIDDETAEGICVIDLDTVMPGLPMYDFGDSIRIGANPAPEDERDLSKVCMNLEMFDRLAAGYLAAAKDFLLPIEIEHLAFSARLITYEQCMRFLGDHLSGDVYYKIHRADHNLDRARTQMKMVLDMEEKAGQMAETIRKYAS